MPRGADQQILRCAACADRAGSLLCKQSLKQSDLGEVGDTPPAVLEAAVDVPFSNSISDLPSDDKLAVKTECIPSPPAVKLRRGDPREKAYTELSQSTESGADSDSADSPWGSFEELGSPAGPGDQEGDECFLEVDEPEEILMPQEVCLPPRSDMPTLVGDEPLWEALEAPEPSPPRECVATLFSSDPRMKSRVMKVLAMKRAAKSKFRKKLMRSFPSISEHPEETQ